nr:MAG TPA: SPINDLE AND KINETOCHORE-ASSOCIATED PROTEIN 3 CYCLE, SKA COMPLEX, MITOSIS.32A [Caudoviricetes sp.]
MHPLKSRTAPPSEPKMHPLTRFLSKLRFFAISPP